MQPAKLGALVARSAKPIFTAADQIPLTARGLVSLASYCPAEQDVVQLLRPVRKFARRDASFLSPLLCDAAVMDPQVATHSRRAAVALRAVAPLPASPHVDEVLRVAVLLVTAALRAGAWPASDLHGMLVVLRQRGVCSDELLVAVADYIRARAVTATALEAADLVAIATLFPEVYKAGGSGAPTTMDALMTRVAHVAEEMTPGMVGAVCGNLNRGELRSGVVALALQEEADRIAQSCDARTAVEFLLFICRQEAKFISSDSVQWLLERVMGEALDAVAVLHLCRALRSLPLTLKEQLRGDLVDVVAFVSSQMAALVEAERVSCTSSGSPSSALATSLASDFTQVLLGAFLGLHRVLVPAPPDLTTMLPAYLAAVDACAALVEDGLEDLEGGAEGLSLALVGALLEAPTNAARSCGGRVLREYARECVHLPALQTFRFLVVLGDAAVRDVAVLQYLRGCFAKTAADIPPAQLCTALRCFVACGGFEEPVAASGAGAAALTAAAPVAGDEVERERGRGENAAFHRFAKELARKWFAAGMPMRFGLALVEALHELGCRDEHFYEDAAIFLETRRPTATAAVHSAETATVVCLALGEDLLDRYPDLHAFLLAVEAEGTRGEARLPPSRWMDLHDPANALGPLTEAQQESRDLVDRMAATRADDRATLVALAEAYLKLLPFIRPDDHKHFFAVCETKVLKEDRLLRECLTQLGAIGITPKLSGSTIGSLLHSLAALRFAYPRATRRFLEGVSEEQWREMDAAPLVQILSAMARLSLRMPRQLDLIAERVSTLSRLLSARDVAEAVRALQGLGYQDGAVVDVLMASAAARASGFDEVSLTTLFAAPAVHRLLRTPEVAGPLLRQACCVVSSPHTRQRIAVKLRRGGLSRDLLESCAGELRMLSGPGAADALRLA